MIIIIIDYRNIMNIINDLCQSSFVNYYVHFHKQGKRALLYELVRLNDIAPFISE